MSAIDKEKHNLCKQAEDIVNVVVRDHGTESWAKFQMCKRLGQDKTLGSVSK